MAAIENPNLVNIVNHGIKGLRWRNIYSLIIQKYIINYQKNNYSCCFTKYTLVIALWTLSTSVWFAFLAVKQIDLILSYSFFNGSSF